MYPDEQWLQPHELKPGVFLDLKAENNDYGLSIYEVPSGTDPTEIAVAVAVGPDMNKPDHVDYVVFDGSELDQVYWKLRKNDGTTPDHHVNSLHYDLYYLSASAIFALAEIMSRGCRGRVLKKAVKNALSSWLDSGRLQPEQINPQLLAQLQQ